jgi:hypothetical protein
MTKQQFYLDRSEDAYRTAKNICQSRRERAGITGLCDADVEMEYCLILQDWYDDYREERV